MAEMRMSDLGGIPLEHFVRGAMAGYGTTIFTKRTDHPWSGTLLGSAVGKGDRWTNAMGKPLTSESVVREMLDAPFFPAERPELACYDFHTVYAATAAVRAGHTIFQEEARKKMRDAFERAETFCSRLAQGDGMEAVVSRIKLYGHAVEAYFRGGEALAGEEFRPYAEHAIAELLRDSKQFRDLTKYEGPPEVFIAIPHAVHGLDLAAGELRRANRN
jgi:hypothetical protein